MSDFETIDDPMAALSTIRQLLVPEEEDDKESFEIPSTATSPKNSAPATPEKSAQEKGKMIVKGEGRSGKGRTPTPKHTRAVRSSQDSLIDFKLPLQIPDTQEETTPSKTDNIISQEVIIDVPMGGESGGPEDAHEEEPRWATKADLDDLAISLDEFIKQEISEALVPILRELKVMAADIKSVVGSSNTLTQRIATIQTRIAVLEKSPPTLLKQDTVGSTQSPPPQSPTLIQMPGRTAVLPSQPKDDSPYGLFLKENPKYIPSSILRKIKLQALGRTIGKEVATYSIGPKDWNSTGIKKLFGE
jgi:hypothetical protein